MSDLDPKIQMDTGEPHPQTGEDLANTDEAPQQGIPMETDQGIDANQVIEPKTNPHPWKEASKLSNHDNQSDESSQPIIEEDHRSETPLNKKRDQQNARSRATGSASPTRDASESSRRPRSRTRTNVKQAKRNPHSKYSIADMEFLESHNVNLDDIAIWASLGFQVEQVIRWHAAEFSPHIAMEWKKIGLSVGIAIK
ncbi:hypothetical protein DSO57_1019497 [Entomophthora muscae]|uniref:Uncharacterized protein n=1 Tax=Entomophthora muscae TaxID=34485 RepID=A0ACC2ST68_9FUNG|nr:hypothetical protein DSO57_1019497 [Entomophthora muscae]